MEKLLELNKLGLMSVQLPLLGHVFKPECSTSSLTTSKLNVLTQCTIQDHWISKIKILQHFCCY
jgi:hypothetical protein